MVAKGMVAMSNQINNRYNLNDAIIRQTEQLNSAKPRVQEKSQSVQGGPSFQELLNQQLTQKISFSKHANQRTEERNISLSQGDLVRLGEACDKAQQKGIKDALVIMKDSAFIVNAPNKVVITVIDKNEMNNNVFTNIDGAVFI